MTTNHARTLQQQLSLTDNHLKHKAIAHSLALAADNGSEPTLQSTIDLLASVAWSAITEPGDEFGGFVREQLGDAESLALLINSEDTKTWALRLLDSHSADLADARFVALEQTISESIARWKPRVSLSRVNQLLEISERCQIVLLNQSHPSWPGQLSKLRYAQPAMLWLRGSTAVLQSAAFSAALVGSRTASNYGFEVTTSLVQGLADAGAAIVSGGAIGIDAIAHRAALAVEAPTVAVMAGGVNRLYPRTNDSLLSAIVERGALISEVSPDTLPTKWRFLQRNRIIAALSSCSVVVEAGYRSGAINTANHANSLNIAVGAVPGSIFSATSAGCHRLISEGKAEIVTSARDVVVMIENSQELPLGLKTNGGGSTALLPHGQSSNIVENLMPLDLRVYDAIGFKSLSLADITVSAGLTTNEAMQGIGSLTLLGIVSEANGRWARA